MSKLLEKENMNFVSKLNNDDLIEIYKIALKQQYGVNFGKVHVVENDFFIILKSNKKAKKLLYKKQDNINRYVFVLNKEAVTKVNYHCTFIDDHKFRNYLAVLIGNFGLKKESFSLKFTRYSDILINDFDFIMGGANNVKLNKTKYYEFMYKKFGEEYITALKEFNERESKERLEYEQKKVDNLVF